MSEKLDSLLTPQQKIDVAIADYIAARNAHPYHASKTAQTMAEIDDEVSASARERSIVLMLRAKSILVDAARTSDAEMYDAIILLNRAIERLESQRRI